jgi:hypothetical protein
VRRGDDDERRLRDRLGVRGEHGQRRSVEHHGVKLHAIDPADHRALGAHGGLAPARECLQPALVVLHIGADPHEPLRQTPEAHLTVAAPAGAVL